MHRITTIAIFAEGALAVLAIAVSALSGHPIMRGGIVGGAIAGLAGAAALAGVNYWVVRHAPQVAPVRALRDVVDTLLVPAFAGIRTHEAAMIAIAAGVGEELLFRGVLQHEWGIVAASVLFGAAHTGGIRMLLFGCWAALMGFLLGGIAIWTGGVFAPIVAHAVYDFAAILYIRRAAVEESTC